MGEKRLFTDLDELLGRLGFELVSLERGGGRRRPVIRLRIDRPGGDPGRSSVTTGDCARVTRAVEEFFEGRRDVPGDHVLEVSSPGVERPLVRPRDYRRFAGRDVFLRGYGPLTGGDRRVRGTLIGIDDAEESVRIEVSGERVEIPLESIAKATLVHRWEEEL